MEANRSPRYHTDPAGHLVATVALAGGAGEVEMLAADLDALKAAGVSPVFNFNRAGKPAFGYVRAQQLGGNTVTVARFIARAGRGQVVRYVDGNRLNLRRENLMLDQGRAKMDCRFPEKISEGDR